MTRQLSCQSVPGIGYHLRGLLERPIDRLALIELSTVSIIAMRFGNRYTIDYII